MPIEIHTLFADDREAIEDLLDIVGTYEPSLEQIWLCMDAVWDQLGCDNKYVDLERMSQFYSHPVWLLNGLFIEQHALSLKNREIVSDWIAERGARRIADFGGGFGTLARMIAGKCPRADVDVIEPFPNQFAIQKSKKFTNIRYQKRLDGLYDLIVAMDVFEHVSDPLRLVRETAEHLRRNGIYLTANCFHPVIKCHLPITFHFRRSWNMALRMMKLRHLEDVCYGGAFRKVGDGGIIAARVVESVSRSSFLAAEWSNAVRSQLRVRTRIQDAIARIAPSRVP